METDKHRTTCRQCGTCCRKGGPALHQTDKTLIDSGKILVKNLFTIRSGEMVHDNVNGALMPAESEIIKIKGGPGSWQCVFLNHADNHCRIYTQRPLECRVLKCWDTDGIIEIYGRQRLTRRDLLSQISGLWDLVCEHQARCAYDRLGALIHDGGTDHSTEVPEPVLEIINYDLHIRRLVVEKSHLDAEMLDFLFGRPLVETVRMFGLKLTTKQPG